MYTNTRKYVAQCETCHIAKANRHPVKAQVQIREVPPEIFQRVHMDHVKINVKNAMHKYTHALVHADANSLCCALIPVKSISAAETCRAILREWIAHYGIFSELVMDRHASFTGKLTKMLTEACGIRHIFISAYHSRSNGQVERMNELVLQGIRVHCKNMENWPQLLPAIAASYKAAKIPSRGISPFQLLYGVNMRLPVETSLAKLLPAHTRPSQSAENLAKQLSLMREVAQQNAQNSWQRATKAINKTKTTPEFELGQKVYKVKDVLGDDEDHKTAAKFEGPYIIVDRAPHNVYKVKHFNTGKTLNSYVHVDKLKASDTARAARCEHKTIETVTRLCKCKKRRYMAYRNVAKATAAGTDHEVAIPEEPDGAAEKPVDEQPERAAATR